MIIDAHTHIFPPALIADRGAIAASDRWFDAFYGGGARMANAQDLLTEMDRAGVERSLLFGFGWASDALHRRCNEYVLEQAASSQGRLRAAISVPAGDNDATLKEIEYWDGAEIAGIGELYASQGFDLGRLTQASPLPDLCAERGWILCVHVSEPVGHTYRGKDGSGPRQIGQFLAAMPENLRLQLPHWGAGFGIYEAMPEIAARSGAVRYDCAASHLLYDRSIYPLMARIAPARIMFGSDFPLTTQLRMLRRVRGAGLAPDQLDALLGGNAAAWGI